MSRLYSSGLSAPIPAIICAESSWTGSAEMSRFHQLSAGNTWSAASTASASGVSNISGFVIFGIGGRARSAANPAAATSSTAVAVRTFIVRSIVVDSFGYRRRFRRRRPSRTPSQGSPSVPSSPASALARQTGDPGANPDVTWIS